MSETETYKYAPGDGWMTNYPRHLVEAIAAGGPDTPAESQRVAKAELERREPRLAVFATIGAGKSVHLLKPPPARPKDGTAVHTLCGLQGEPASRHEADARAVRVAGHAVCGNCVDRLTVSGVTGIVQVQPTRRRPTVATSTERKKARSEPLLDLNAYADQPLERLEQERTTINNRLSGLGTQVKRHTAAGATDKANAAQARHDDLTATRTILADAIAAKKAGQTERPSEAAMREVGDVTTAAGRRANSEARQAGGAKKAAARKKTSRKTAAKKATSRKTSTKRATAKKKTASARKTTRRR